MAPECHLLPLMANSVKWDNKCACNRYKGNHPHYLFLYFGSVL